jgi:uncharacterized membrane protein YjjB (DUF3815 family)
MTKILIFFASTAGGYAGWWVGSFGGTAAAFIVSMIGTAAGVYYGRRFAMEYT